MDDSPPPDRKVVHFCATCNRRIVDENYIQCTFCKGFIQCLECFADGYEKDNHVKEHPIIMMGESTSPIFTKNWTIEEELYLLNSVALCGIGNWDNISDQIKTKTPLECEVHYFSTYFKNYTAPFPDFTQPIQEPEQLPSPLLFDTSPQESCPSDGHERNLILLNRRDKTNPAEVSGYMPKRHEFEEEFNEEAEHLIDSINFNDGISNEEFERYCQLLELYNTQIVEREIRTKVIEDWGVQYNKFKNLGGSTPKEKDIDSKILPLAQFLGKDKTEKLAEDFHKLIRNEEIIESRIHWQKNGVRSLQEGFFLNKLEAIIKDNKVPDNEIPKWNKLIESQKAERLNVSNTDDEKLLNEKEAEFCKYEEIKPPIYAAMKDLFIRECVARGGLSKNEALRMVPDMQKQGDLVYDLLLSFSWINE